ncbi:MAG: NAD-dependent epimerase/dehydratase family protein [Paracoccaceae bacterium]
MRVLVTGSSGLVGAALAGALERAGIGVTRFDCRDGDGAADIRDPDRLAGAIAGCDGVFHLAAVSRVAWGEATPGLCRTINVAATRNVLSAAVQDRARPWLVFASSREVYGSLTEGPATEETPFAPLNIYGETKVAGEQDVVAAAEYGVRAAIVRLSNVYGGLNDHPDRAVPSLLWAAMQGKPLTISGAETFFDFVHVDDCVTGLIAAMNRLVTRKPGGPVHLVSGKATSLLELAEQARSVAGSASAIIVNPARPFDVPGFVGDPERAAELLNWRADIGLREGLERLFADLRRRGRPMDPVAMPPEQMTGRDYPAMRMARAAGGAH